MKPAIAYLAAVAVHEDIPELEAFTTRWQPVGYFPSEQQAKAAALAAMKENGADAYTILRPREPGEHPFYDKLAARLAARLAAE